MADNSEIEQEKPTSLDRRVTLRDVADLAGVSVAAVSRYFTPGASISPKLRAKVEVAANTLGYLPNALARSLSTAHSHMIGIVVGEFSNPFYPLVVDEICTALQAVGRRGLLFTIPEGQTADDILPQVLEYRVGGVIITSATLSERTAELCDRFNVPVVLINRSELTDRLNSVACDNAAGAHDIAEHFAAIGCRHVGFLGGKKNTSTNQQRESAFLQRIADLGLNLACIDHGNYTYEDARAAARSMVEKYRPDALFCANDIMALGAIDAIRYDLGLQVPDDVAVAGFDDLQIARFRGYDLTTVQQPVREMVAEAVSILTEPSKASSVATQHVQLPGKLITRSSTKRQTS